MQRTDSTQRALDASRNSMQLTESALSDAGDLLQQARELVVSAGNASYTDAERADVANQLTAIRNQLLGVANRADGTGGYVFAGQGASQPPYIDRPGGVDYVGTGGAVRVASDEPLPLTLDGNATWLTASTGNGVFETRVGSSQSAWIDTGRVTDPEALTGASYSIQFNDTAAPPPIPSCATAWPPRSSRPRSRRAQRSRSTALPSRSRAHPPQATASTSSRPPTTCRCSTPWTR